MTDPVADALSRLYNREAAAQEAFRAAALTALARFPSVAAEREGLLGEALDKALAAQAEFKSLEDAGRRQALRAVAAAIFERIFGGTLDAASPEQALYAKLEGLPKNAKRLAILTFVKRENFADVIQQLNLKGGPLSVEITSMRKLVNPEATNPPAPDFPAYSRVPFLVSGHLEPDDALRVREYLGQSDVCRAAYRDLDTLERGLARLGLAAGEPHPEPEEWIAIADGKSIPANRRDALAEHERLCRGCAAIVADARLTAETGPAGDLVKKLDLPRNRVKLAIAAGALSFALPLLTLELTRGRKFVLEFGGVGALDVGAPLRDEPDRKALILTDPSAPLRIVVDVERDLAHDLRLESLTEGEIVSYGDAPIRDLGAGKGEIVLTVVGAKLPAGDYRLHVLRRKRGAGGEPRDGVYPIIVR